MNSATLSKIANASDFLIQFRRLPRYVQDLVRPHLDEPHQTALKVLDCCSELEGCLVSDIAAIANLNRESTRQVLTALEGKLVIAEETMQGKAWKLRIQGA
jgi:hypothetical protein